MNRPQDLAIYIHWPFCKSKCPYCDFYKELARGCDEEKIIDEYLCALKKYYFLMPKRKIKSIFFGGGTPSLISPKNIEKIINFICKNWAIQDDIEISLFENDIHTLLIRAMKYSREAQKTPFKKSKLAD